MKKVILIDLDHTLIDTERVKREHESILRRFGVSASVSKKAYRKVIRRGFYHPVPHMHAVIPDSLSRRRALREYWQLFEKKEAYNFPGVVPFLKTLSKKYRLILLSWGHKDFQLKKFNQTGFGKFFETTVVMKNRRKEKDLQWFFGKYGGNVLLLDDSPVAISVARKIGIKTVRVKKGKKDANYYRRLLARIMK
ncbi:MAG: NIF family HAD-type phosphatase [Minisyncoccia bacterium]|jgi:FMN phosphatase YigB (HAD superfamily)